MDYEYVIEGVYQNNEGVQLEVSTDRGFVVIKWMGREDYVYLTFTPEQAANAAGSILRASDHISRLPTPSNREE